MLKNIKLVIWDLDETFWKGTLSEGKITFIQENNNIIRQMTDKGIVNSICSKNDFEEVKTRLVESDNLWDYFVFPSIDWTPKGERIRQLIQDMNLRAVNVLFIDDNKGNLQEALYYNEGIQVLDAENLRELYQYVSENTDSDPEHSRLQRYKVLETKKCEMTKASSNEEFLRNSSIHVYVDYECKDVTRIEELIARTNQLNYTKKRIGEDEIKRLIADKRNLCGTVYVKDRFGEYGMVGFFCMRKETKYLDHYLFSCRTLGMGVEQWVYQMLKFPSIDIIEPVTVTLQPEKVVTWIYQDTSFEQFSHIENNCQPDTVSVHNKNHCRILIKGPCDMFALQPFLGGCEIKTEFNHVNNAGVTISSHNHSCQIVEADTLSKEEVADIILKAPFLDESAFETEIYSDKYDIVFLSLLTDCLQGIYRSKEKGYLISISSINYPLTDLDYIKKYGASVNGYPLNEAFLEKFSENFIYEGMQDIQDIIDNIEYIREHMSKNTLLILMLGSEIECDKNNESFAGCAQRHKNLNDAVLQYFAGRTDVKFINYTEFIRGQNSFIDCTDHLTKETYYDIAGRMTEMINAYMGGKIALAHDAHSLKYIISKGYRKLTKILGKNNYQ